MSNQMSTGQMYLRRSFYIRASILTIWAEVLSAIYPWYRSEDSSYRLDCSGVLLAGLIHTEDGIQ